MAQQLFRVPSGLGFIPVLDEANAGLKYLSFAVLRLRAGQSWSGESGEEEMALVSVSGKFGLKVEGLRSAEWSGIGGRTSVFAGAPGAACVPRASVFLVTGESDCELAVFKSRTDADAAPALVRPEDIATVNSGSANWRRDVKMIFPPGTGLTSRLIIGETLNPPGNWSGFPPHKHDAGTVDEYPLEEIYYFKLQPADCFGVQVSYGGKEEDAAHIITDDTVAVFRSGYHPTSATPGVQVSYLWALAGAERNYKVSIDPRYRWLSHAESILRESQKYYR